MTPAQIAEAQARAREWMTTFERAGRVVDLADLPAPPPPPSAPLRVGGEIKPPVKTKDVEPVYPAVALSARVQGLIMLEATIDPTGKVVDIKPLGTPQPLLVQAAIDAVRQWEYAPTLLNGAPVPLIMTVTVNFALK
jgi:protein TonB